MFSDDPISSDCNRHVTDWYVTGTKDIIDRMMFVRFLTFSLGRKVLHAHVFYRKKLKLFRQCLKYQGLSVNHKSIAVEMWLTLLSVLPDTGKRNWETTKR